MPYKSRESRLDYYRKYNKERRKKQTLSKEEKEQRAYLMREYRKTDAWKIWYQDYVKLNKEKIKKRWKDYYNKNKDNEDFIKKRKQQKKEQYKRHSDTVKKWKEDNKEKVKKQQKKANNKRRKEMIEYARKYRRKSPVFGIRKIISECKKGNVSTTELFARMRRAVIDFNERCDGGYKL